MIPASLEIVVVAATLALSALLVAGARVKRAGTAWALAWALLLAAAAGLVTRAGFGAAWADVAPGAAAVVALMLVVARIEPDWNPIAQACLATTVLTSVAFVLLAASFTFSAPISRAAHVAGALMLALQLLTLALLVGGVTA